jgi:hypothetical protein
MTENSDARFRNSIGVFMISLGVIWRVGENIKCNWKHQGVLVTSLGALMTSSGVPATCLGVPRITLDQSGKYNIFFGNTAGGPENHSYYLLFKDCYNSCIQFIFSSIYLCIYIATHLDRIYLDWLQKVLESNSRCTRK